MLSPEPPAALPLTVGSYNVHGCVGGDGRRDVARIARVVRALEADLVALQEVDGPGGPQQAADAAAELAERTGLHPIRGVTMLRRGAEYGNLVLTRFPPRSVRRIDLSVGRMEPRGALDVDFDIRGARVRLLATHLGLVPGERRRQVKQLIEQVRTGAAGDEAATLLLGDINEWFALGRPLRWLHRCFEGTGHGGRTFPSRFPLFALDRIWVQPKSALVSYEVVRSAEARLASDHLPVRARLVLGLGRRQGAASRGPAPAGQASSSATGR